MPVPSETALDAAFDACSRPEADPWKAGSRWQVGNLTFRADFDSGNLREAKAGSQADEYMLYPRPDNWGTPWQSGHRSWFYFAVKGHARGDTVTFIVNDINKQKNLFAADHRPVYRHDKTMAAFEPVRWSVRYKRNAKGEGGRITFAHRFATAEEVYFAFCHPFAYSDSQRLLFRLDAALHPASVALTRAASRSLSLPGPTFLDEGLPEPPEAAAEGEDGAAASSVAPTPRRPSLWGRLFAPSGNARAAGAPPSSTGAPERGTVDDDSDASGSEKEGAEPLRSWAEAETAPRSESVAEDAGPGTTALGDAREGSARDRGGEGLRDPPAGIYYRRQLLCRSRDGLRVDMLTITAEDPAETEAETLPDDPALFPDRRAEGAAPLRFASRRVLFVSARVHPGETPGSAMCLGALRFLLSQDPRARALRDQFVVKVVPMLNPDGVRRGHYRQDGLGQNLNRCYADPTPERHPAIYAVRTMLLQWSKEGRLAFYLDLHAHANKRGVFAFGNHIPEDPAKQIEGLMYAQLCALNCPHFDLQGCVFTERNMSTTDRAGDSKEGAGRVALFRATGLAHIYTVESHYSAAGLLSPTLPATLGGGAGGRCVSPGNRATGAGTLGRAELAAAGRALLVSALDALGRNPCSRLPGSELGSREELQAWVRQCLAAVLASKGGRIQAVFSPPLPPYPHRRQRARAVDADAAGGSRAPPPARALSERRLRPAGPAEPRPGASVPVRGRTSGREHEGGSVGGTEDGDGSGHRTNHATELRRAFTERVLLGRRRGAADGDAVSGAGADEVAGKEGAGDGGTWGVGPTATAVVPVVRGARAEGDGWRAARQGPPMAQSNMAAIAMPVGVGNAAGDRLALRPSRIPLPPGASGVSQPRVAGSPRAAPTRASSALYRLAQVAAMARQASARGRPPVGGAAEAVRDDTGSRRSAVAADSQVAGLGQRDSAPGGVAPDAGRGMGRRRSQVAPSGMVSDTEVLEGGELHVPALARGLRGGSEGGSKMANGDVAGRGALLAMLRGVAEEGVERGDDVGRGEGDGDGDPESPHPRASASQESLARLSALSQRARALRLSSARKVVQHATREGDAGLPQEADDNGATEVSESRDWGGAKRWGPRPKRTASLSWGIGEGGDERLTGAV